MVNPMAMVRAAPGWHGAGFSILLADLHHGSENHRSPGRQPATPQPRQIAPCIGGQVTSATLRRKSCAENKILGNSSSERGNELERFTDELHTVWPGGLGGVFVAPGSCDSTKPGHSARDSRRLLFQDATAASRDDDDGPSRPSVPWQSGPAADTRFPVSPNGPNRAVANRTQWQSVRAAGVVANRTQWQSVRARSVVANRTRWQSVQAQAWWRIEPDGNLCGRGTVPERSEPREVVTNRTRWQSAGAVVGGESNPMAICAGAAAGA